MMCAFQKEVVADFDAAAWTALQQRIEACG